ncbi:MAG: T9SS type A sorting domain-containing protein [Rhodothermaceae bacterium]|nr:T9SS type A sorting domain-containing protein [Rhodothermaceae bacterium]
MRLLSLTLLFGLTTTILHAQSFQGLGLLPGASSGTLATGISADGSTVVGWGVNSEGQTEAFRWTAGGGMVGLGTPGGLSSYAEGVSADGSVVVGLSSVGAFRWTEAGGMEGLGFIHSGDTFSRSFDVSDDGNVVVGQSADTVRVEAFRWTAAGGMEGLGDLDGERIQSTAFGISADGSVIVGQGRSASGREAFRWTAAGGMEALGMLPADTMAWALDVSADGSVIVGNSFGAGGSEAFRWTEAGGMQGLGGAGSLASSVSADGTVVVGTNSGTAFIWTEEGGMRALSTVLEEDYGLDLTGWTLTSATGLSADGSVITGFGRSPGGTAEAWRVVLSTRWLDPVSGFFNEPFRWSLDDIPGEQHSIRFDAPSLDPYTVTFVQDQTTRSLAVDESTVELDLGSATYSVLEDLSVGAGGNGAHLFTSGGALATGPSAIARAAGEAGSLIVGDTGTPTTLSVDGALVVGWGGTGSFGLTGTATIESGLVVGFEEESTGIVSVHSGVLQVPEGVLGTAVGDAGTGTLTVEGGGLLSVFGTLTVGSEPTGNGLLALTGEGASGTTHGPLVVGDQGTGGLDVTEGATLFSTDVVLGREQGSLGTALLEGAGSRWEITGAFDVGLDGAALVTLLSGSVLCLHDDVIWNIGTQGVLGGDVTISLLTENCPDLLQGDGAALRSGGSQVFASTLMLFPGATLEAEALVLGEGGTLGGDGALALPITNAGTLAPGGIDTAGVFALTDAYTQASEGALEIEFRGAAPGAGHDQLAVTGDAVLGGLLRLQRLEGYTPMVGEAYTLLTAASVTGTFDTVEEPPDVALDVSYTATEVIATVTAVTVGSEPGGALPNTFALHAAYPNPFTSQAVVPFEMAEADHMRLAVYDLLGRELAVLVDGWRAAGQYQALLDGRGLPSGTYLVRMTTGDGFTQSRRVLVLR